MDAVMSLCCGCCKRAEYDSIPYADVQPSSAPAPTGGVGGGAAPADYSNYYGSESAALLGANSGSDSGPAAPPALAPAPAPAAAPEPDPEPAAPLVAASAVSVGEKVTVLALAECEAAVLGAGMKFNPPRKKRCGTSGVVASIDGIKVKVTFEDIALDPSTGEVARVDTATMLFPVSALANDPDAAPAATEAPAAVEETPAPAAVEEPAAAMLGGSAGLGPAFTRGEIEPPAGEKAMGGAVIGVYTEEQQARLGVDEEGKKVEAAAAPAAEEPAVTTPQAAPEMAAEAPPPAEEPAAMLGGSAGLGPAFTRGEIEPPAGEKAMGGAVIGVYTEEQQARLGVDEEGKKVEAAEEAAAAVAPSLDEEVDRI